jgi:hypothetical protein
MNLFIQYFFSFFNIFIYFRLHHKQADDLCHIDLAYFQDLYSSNIELKQYDIFKFPDDFKEKEGQVYYENFMNPITGNKDMELAF